MKNLFLFLFLAVLAFSACDSASTNEENTTDDSNLVDSTLTEVEVADQFCYLKVFIGEPYTYEGNTIPMNDTTRMSFTLADNNSVEGSFEYLPAEKDSQRGTFKGQLMDGILKATYIYYQEGDEYTEEIQFKISDTNAIGLGNYEFFEALPKVECR